MNACTCWHFCLFAQNKTECSGFVFVGFIHKHKTRGCSGIRMCPKRAMCFRHPCRKLRHTHASQARYVLPTPVPQAPAYACVRSALCASDTSAASSGIRMCPKARRLGQRSAVACVPTMCFRHQCRKARVHAFGSSGADLGSGIACWRMSASSVVRSRRAGRSLVSVSETM